VGHPIPHVHQIADEFDAMRQGIRNAARWPLWNKARAFGTLQISVQGSVWTPRMNGMAHLGRLDWQEFSRGLASIWPDDGRVVVQTFERRPSVSRSISRHVSGQLARLCDGEPAMAATYFRALYEGSGGGYRPITFCRGLGPMVAEEFRLEVPEVAEPMPCLFACSANEYTAPLAAIHEHRWLGRDRAFPALLNMCMTKPTFMPFPVSAIVTARITSATEEYRLWHVAQHWCANHITASWTRRFYSDQGEASFEFSEIDDAEKFARRFSLEARQWP
jgi:hypothetical protein